MKKSTAFGSLFVAVLLATFPQSVVVAQPGPFEGTVTFSLVSPMLGGEPTEMHMNIKGKKVVSDMDLGQMGLMHVYVDHEKQTITTLLDNMKAGTEIDIPTDTSSATLTPTGKTETVDGYRAEEYTGSIGGGTMDIWVTADLPENLRNAMIEAMRSNPQAGGSKAFAALLAKGLAPVRMKMSKDGQEQATLDLVKFEQKHLDDSIFVPPADAKITHKSASELRQYRGGH